MALSPAARASIFIQFDAERILAEAAAADADGARANGLLAAQLISIKDLFDEGGQTTSGGSIVLAGAAPAQRDAEAVRRLRAAGAIACGRTSMSEFAYSGVGLNPHFGNPGNRADPARIAGGSTSGGALSVALDIADLALGSDTGGSVRIPAALNGLCGFKPSQAAVPRAGMLALSQSYDSVGPIARSVAACASAFAVLSGTTPKPGKAGAARIGVVGGALLEGLDNQVAADFERAKTSLGVADFTLIDVDMPALAGFGAVNRVIVAAEAYRVHAPNLQRMGVDGDPRILRRILAAETFSDTDEADARAQRAAAIAAFADQAAAFDAFIMPTVPTVAPLIADVEADFDRLNALMLRNPSAVNFLDGCAVSVPMHADQQLGTGLTIFAPGGRDWQVLDLARRAEAVLGK